MAVIRFLHLIHEIREILLVSHLLQQKNQSQPLYLSFVPLSAYRQHTEMTGLGVFEWHRIHQGRVIHLRSLYICEPSQTIDFYDQDESIFFSLTQAPMFLRRKEPILIKQEEKLGLIEVITKEHRLLISFTLSQWPSLVFPYKK
ncbi:hypothetical protein [Aneurinibacillus sp. REN35]|uniref:hypothetical protein n=1 Tax=Aneurinibacillus sp. REN35 TaxID=3237286 RepID=UPI003528AF6F